MYFKQLRQHSESITALFHMSWITPFNTLYLAKNQKKIATFWTCFLQKSFFKVANFERARTLENKDKFEQIAALDSATQDLSETLKKSVLMYSFP